MTSDVSLMKVGSLVTREKNTIKILANELCRTGNCRYNGYSRMVYFMYFRQQVENSTHRVVLKEVGGTAW